jgi:hypothetical protein
VWLRPNTRGHRPPRFRRAPANAAVCRHNCESKISPCSALLRSPCQFLTLPGNLSTVVHRCHRKPELHPAAALHAHPRRSAITAPPLGPLRPQCGCCARYRPCLTKGCRPPGHIACPEDFMGWNPTVGCTSECCSSHALELCGRSLGNRWVGFRAFESLFTCKLKHNLVQLHA